MCSFKIAIAGQHVATLTGFAGLQVANTAQASELNCKPVVGAEVIDPEAGRGLEHRSAMSHRLARAKC